MSPQTPTSPNNNNNNNTTNNLERSEQLRVNVIEADEMHRRVHNAANTGGSFCAKRRMESKRMSTKVLEQLAEFERNITMSGTRRFSYQKFLQDTKLSVPTEKLTQPSEQSVVEPILRLQRAIQRLADVHARTVRQQQQQEQQRQTREKMNSNNKNEEQQPEEINANNNNNNNDSSRDTHSISHSSNFYATHRFLNERAPELLTQIIDAHKKAALNGEVWASIPDPLLVLLDDVITCAPTDSVLEESEESRKRLAFGVEELSHQQQQAIEEGDMKSAEELYFKKVTVQESMVPLYDNMNNILDEHHQTTVMGPASRAQEIHSRATSEISTIANKNESRKKEIQSDLKSLLSVQKQVTDEDRELRHRFGRLRSDSDTYLKENENEMERCYQAMEELERHVARLAAERSEAVAKRISADVQEAQRVCDLENFLSFTKQHKLLLETSLRTVDASDEVTDLFHELVSSGSNSTGQRIRALESDIETTRVKLHELRLSQFRNLYLTLGDLQYKKERNLEELDKKIEQVHIQQEIAMDTFNPKAKELAQAKKELMSIREEMDSQIGIINGKAQLQIEYFKPTEEALRDAGKEFVHPVEELAQKNEQRQHKLLEYHQLMQSTAEDPTTAALGGGNVEEEMHHIEELRHQMDDRYNKNSPNRLRGASARGEINTTTTSTTTSKSEVTTSVPALD